MKSMYAHICGKAVRRLMLAAIGLAVGAAQAQVPSSALHRGGMDSGAAAAARTGPAISDRAATLAGPAQSALALRIVDPQDNAQRTRSNFRVTILTSAAYANRLATVTVHQQAQAAVPTTAGYTNPSAGFSLPVSKDAQWDVQVSQLLQGWSPPVTRGWFDPNLWFETVTGSAVVGVSFAIPERGERLSAQTHVMFGKVAVAGDERSAKRPPQWTPAPSRAPASGGPRP